MYQIKFKSHTFTIADPNRTTDKTYRVGLPIHSAEDTARAAEAIYSELDSDKEHFVMLALTNKNRLIGFKVISTGCLTASLVHPREVFHAALVLEEKALREGEINESAAALIFLHNHPSGDPAPSREDIELTKRLKDAGELLGFRVLDHVVLGAGRFFSFNEKGML